MARVAETLGRGGPSLLQRELGWSRETNRKGSRELKSGFICYDNFMARGRPRSEVQLPNLLADIQAIADQHSQTDPSFKRSRLYLRLSAASVRQQLLEQKGYREEALSSQEVIRQRLNELGYIYLARGKKSQPTKQAPETDAIFAQLAQVNPAPDAEATTLLMSVDAKATIPLGLFSRGGYSQLALKAWDHDFKPQEKVTPVGVFLPQENELYLFLFTGPLTADALVDCIRYTWYLLADRFLTVRTLLLNLDNGPENHSHRTQFMYRLTALADERQLTIALAYYPPYHSKYNPVEWVWGVLEQHWNGTLLDSLHTVVHLAQTITYNHVHPVVKRITTTYHTGVKLTQRALA